MFLYQLSDKAGEESVSEITTMKFDHHYIIGQYYTIKYYVSMLAEWQSRGRVSQWDYHHEVWPWLYIISQYYTMFLLYLSNKTWEESVRFAQWGLTIIIHYKVILYYVSMIAEWQSRGRVSQWDNHHEVWPNPETSHHSHQRWKRQAVELQQWSTS